LKRPVGRKPPHAAVLVRLFAKDGFVVGAEKEGEVQMQMGRYECAALYMARHGQNFQRDRFSVNRLDLNKPGLFAHFAPRDGQKIGFAVRMTARPRPGTVDIMPDHQHLCVLMIRDPARSREMAQIVIAREDIARETLYVVQDEAGIHGAFYFCVEEDPTYAVIREGTWHCSKPYGVIHRIAGDGSGGSCGLR